MKTRNRHYAYPLAASRSPEENRHPITGHKLSAVELERAARLHRKFLSAEQAIAEGATLEEVFRPYSQYWSRHRFRSDRTRKVRFTFKTLLRLFYLWQKAGRTEECLYRRWRGLRPSVSSAVLTSFVDFCAQRQFPHMKAAFAEFSRSKGWNVRAQNARLSRFNYQQLVYFFTGKRFARLQSARRAVTRATEHLETLRVEYSADIRQRVPARPRRRSGLELSLEGAQL